MEDNYQFNTYYTYQKRSLATRVLKFGIDLAGMYFVANTLFFAALEEPKPVALSMGGLLCVQYLYNKIDEEDKERLNLEERLENEPEKKVL